MNAAPAFSPVARVLAWSVHAYTALGAVAGLAALDASARGQAREAFLWMALALAIDSSDGVLARAARVKDVLPGFDGGKLDDIVDYLNYVVVPIFFAVREGLLPSRWTSFVAALPLLASAYGFCQEAAKTEDFFFTGFPSFWNITVFYVYALHVPAALNAALLSVLSALVLVPWRYVYPTRQPFLRPLTIGLGLLWGMALLVALWRLPAPSPALVWGSLAFPIYYFALSFYLDRRRSTDRATRPAREPE
jgi:phosphatidylcholine synthase